MSLASTLGGGEELPDPVRAKMEASFGADFSGVRVHHGSEAGELGARAYAQGGDLHFAPGQYDPNSAGGQELIGHELAHVVQQTEGRVQETIHAKGLSVNADPALEHEADELGARAARGEPAQTGGGNAGSSGGVAAAQTKLADPAHATADRLTGVEDEADAAPVQAKAHGVIQRDPTFVPHLVPVPRRMTAEEFQAHAMRQIFGGPVKGIWQNVKTEYVPEKSPYTVLVDAAALRGNRGKAAKARGFDVDGKGKIEGADARAQKFQGGPESDQKSALMAEIDRRYCAATGDPPGTKLASSSDPKAEQWRAIRDEVLFQHEYVGNLPPKVKQVIKVSIKGRDLKPADYDQLFRVAKKIESMAAPADYAAKAMSTTTDLDAFEASVDKYLAEMAVRKQQSDERAEIQNKLLGLEDVYKLYRDYKSTQSVENLGALGGGIPSHEASDKKKVELEKQLKLHEFASLAEFEAFIKKFESAFELGAATTAKDLLAKSAGRLGKEAERYRDPAQVTALHQQLNGYRGHHADLIKHGAIWNEYKTNSERSRLPGNGHLQPKITAEEAKQHHDKAEAGKAGAQKELGGLAAANPIFQEDELPVDRRINKAALAAATESSLGGVLQAHLATRIKDIGEASLEIDGKPALIYKMPKLMPRFYAEQEIQPGSIHDMIIQDKMKSDAATKIVVGIVLALIAVALTIVSLGAATPALLAAGAAAGALGISSYMAYEEYKDYTQEKNLADVGMTDDPSVIWLVLAIVGVAVDMAAAVKAVGALGKAAKALNAGGELSEFQKAVQALQKANEIDAKIAEAATKAAAARKGFAEASEALVNAFKAKDPGEIARAMRAMAEAKVKEGYHTAHAYIEEVKKARTLAKLSDMPPEELAKAKQAWEDAVKLAKSAETPVDLMDEGGKLIGRYSNGSHMEVISKGTKLHGGNTIKLDPHATTTVTGGLDDVESIARRGRRLPGATQMGPNPGGINILRSPKWGEIQAKHIKILEAGDELKYWKTVTDEFWNTVNKPWLEQAVSRGDKFRFVSNPASETAIYVTKKNGKDFVLDAGGGKIKSIFGREVDFLKSKGYEFLPDGTAIKKVK